MGKVGRCGKERRRENCDQNMLYEENPFSIKSILATKALCDDYIRIVPEYA